MEVNSGPSESKILEVFRSMYGQIYTAIYMPAGDEPSAACVSTIFPNLWESARYMAGNNGYEVSES
jgi:hypothetical protein